jgi:arylsulfatase A-like enzyme
MPAAPTLAQTFRDNGYQAHAVGKVHVYPQRARIGFDDVLLAEEGRPYWGVTDDYELFLGDRGFAGRQFDHGMSNNEYSTRPWHLPEDCHVTNWTAREMSRTIRRRDPSKPGFWYMSFTHPHPPMVPLQHYWDVYQPIEPQMPVTGDWASEADNLPYRLKIQKAGWHCEKEHDVKTALRSFYALCTHIDHQIRLVIGTLREEGLLENTVVMFTADHGDMLGNHGLWAKRLYYENSANVPMIVMGTDDDNRVGQHNVDDRLVGWQDVMPTLLDLAGLEIPDSVDGTSMVSAEKRDHLYGECNEGITATRMIHSGQHKLIYYPCGNHTQLFDLDADPNETNNLAECPEHAGIKAQLVKTLIGELYGTDLDWLQNGELIGLPDEPFQPGPNRDLTIQRGVHWPPPPQVDPKNDGNPSRTR